MIVTWYIYHTDECTHTVPPKEKFVAIVCLNPNPYGFLINSKIHLFIQAKPNLLAHQVMLDVDKYGFLKHDSFIDCGRILSFKESELNSIQKIQNHTRNEIKKIVSASDLIAPIYKNLICGKSISKKQTE